MEGVAPACPARARRRRAALRWGGGAVALRIIGRQAARGAPPHPLACPPAASGRPIRPPELAAPPRRGGLLGGPVPSAAAAWSSPPTLLAPLDGRPPAPSAPERAAPGSATSSRSCWSPSSSTRSSGPASRPSGWTATACRTPSRTATSWSPARSPTSWGTRPAATSSSWSRPTPATTPRPTTSSASSGCPATTSRSTRRTNPTELLVQPGGTGTWDRVEEPYLPDDLGRRVPSFSAPGTVNAVDRILHIPAGEYFVMGDNRNEFLRTPATSGWSRAAGSWPRRSSGSGR